MIVSGNNLKLIYEYRRRQALKAGGVTMPFPKFLEKQGLTHNAVTETLTGVIERVNRGEEVRLVIATPPRHGKTITILNGFVWLMLQDATRTHAYATYGADLSLSKSRLARQTALNAGIQLMGDSASMKEWRTQAGGGLLATGVGGALTGQGISGLGVVDDPVKNMAEARSMTYRERTWDWFRSVFYTRLEPGSSAIVVATRWHTDDLSGRLIEDGWEYINLPAIENDVALWPEQYPLNKLLDIKRQLGDVVFDALYQGRPRTVTGDLFGEPHYYNELPSAYKTVLAFDAAYTKATSADYSVILAGRFYDDKLYITDMYRAQTNAETFKERIKSYQSQHGAKAHTRIGGTEKVFIEWLRSEGVKVDAQTTKGDKYSNATPLAAAWNRGDILLPRNASWLDPLLAEVMDFTGMDDAHDDIVDALVTAWLSGQKNPSKVVKYI